MRLILKILPQAELVISTHVTVTKTHALVSDVHHDVSNIHDIVVNTHAVISDVHREMQKRGEGADDQNRMVSDTRAIHVAEQTLITV